MDYAKQLLDSIDILAEQKVSDLEYDKTVRASIIEVADASIGKYKVKYQNSTFFAYALDLKSYSKGSNVYVVIPSSDFNKDPYILGTVKKLGADFAEVLNPEDKMTLVGTNIISTENDLVMRLSSYKPQEKLVPITVNKDALDVYKQDSEYLLVGAKFTTSFPDSQKIGTGDFGIKVRCKHWDSRYKSEEETAAADPIIKVYTINVKNMTGQPYNYTGGSLQHVIFPIDIEHLSNIESISVFVKDFPNTKNGNTEGYYNPENDTFYENYLYENPFFPGSAEFVIYDKLTEQWYQWDPNKRTYKSLTDILISNFKLEFYDALTDEEIQGISLRVTTPFGGYFYEKGGEIYPKYNVLGNTYTGVKAEAELRIKGKRVSPDQKVSYYWFIKNSRISTSSSVGYHAYGGPGWECINDVYQTADSNNKASYIAGSYFIYIDYDKCPAYENYIKCVAVFEQDSNITVVDAVKVIYNNTKRTRNNIYIRSLMGTSFNFNTGSTRLTCGIADVPDEILDTYTYAWTRVRDGDVEEVLEGEESRYLNNVDISQARYFITYSCSIWDENDVFLGSAAITLNNEEVKGEYKLVLNNSTQVFKYDAQGISPASPSVDEMSRLDLGKFALSFDIYDDKGQKIEMGSDAEKQRMVDITWIWPSTQDVSPSEQRTNFESMLLPDGQTFIKEEVPNPYGENGFRWVVKNQGNLSYQLQNNYDANKDNNTITLEVVYKGYVLTASTNFTFTKEGELGTNGTKYTTRIVPVGDFNKIVIIHPYGLYGVHADGSYEPLDESIPQFKVELWDGGVRPAVLPNDAVIKWSTALARESQPSPKYLTIDENSGKIEIQVLNVDIKQNNTIKAELSIPSLLDYALYAEYSIDLFSGTNIDPEYWITGGFHNASYESDGSISNYGRHGFVLHKKTGELDLEKILWYSSWHGHIETIEINPATQLPESQSDEGILDYHNNVIIEPPEHYEGKELNNYVACYYDVEKEHLEDYEPICIIPINLYLNKYGLGAINGWDGTSIKLNTTGTNYILAPQMGAGKKEEDGSFTGIVTGTSMENGDENVGLFGYKSGNRSIFLDAQTGNAEFGIAGRGKIGIDAETGKIEIANAAGDGMHLEGDGAVIKSNNFKEKTATEPGAGMEISLSEPHIKFGSGRFTVDKDGKLTASDGHFTGYLDAREGGYIGGFQIGQTTLTGGGGTLTLNSNGSLSGPNWTIATDGVATFRDVRITNKTAGGAGTNSSITWTNSSGSTVFGVTSSGHLTAKSADIGDWTISNGGISRGNFHLGASGENVRLGDGFTVNSSSVSKSNGTHSGSAKNFGLGSGAGNSLGGTEMTGNTAHWLEIEYTYFKSSPNSYFNSWSPGNYHVTVDGKNYTLQGSSWSPQISGWQYYPHKCTIMSKAGES